MKQFILLNACSGVTDHLFWKSLSTCLRTSGDDPQEFWGLEELASDCFRATSRRRRNPLTQAYSVLQSCRHEVGGRRPCGGVQAPSWCRRVQQHVVHWREVCPACLRPPASAGVRSGAPSHDRRRSRLNPGAASAAFGSRVAFFQRFSEAWTRLRNRVDNRALSHSPIFHKRLDVLVSSTFGVSCVNK